MLDNKTNDEYGYALSESELINTTKWATVRAIRDAKLKATDVLILQAQESKQPLSEAWKAYRQALRDTPQLFDNPDQIIWPTQPK